MWRLVNVFNILARSYQKRIGISTSIEYLTKSDHFDMCAQFGNYLVAQGNSTARKVCVPLLGDYFDHL